MEILASLISSSFYPIALVVVAYLLYKRAGEYLTSKDLKPEITDLNNKIKALNDKINTLEIKISFKGE